MNNEVTNQHGRCYLYLLTFCSPADDSVSCRRELLWKGLVWKATCTSWYVPLAQKQGTAVASRWLSDGLNSGTKGRWNDVWSWSIDEVAEGRIAKLFPEGMFPSHLRRLLYGELYEVGNSTDRKLLLQLLLSCTRRTTCCGSINWEQIWKIFQRKHENVAYYGEGKGIG